MQTSHVDHVESVTTQFNLRGQRIKTLKHVAGNEIRFLGHFPDYDIMPGVSIIQAIGQSASTLFSYSSKKGMNERDTWLRPLSTT